MKNFLKNLLVVFFSVIFAFVIGEIFLRVLYPETVVNDSLIGRVGTPGGENDARGFRNENALDRADIVVIGDSQTYGNNANFSREAWPQQLASLSDKSIYQMAIGGYGPIQYRYLFDKALLLHPEKIIIGLYLGNDFNDAFRLACMNDNWHKYCNEEMINWQSDSASKSIRKQLQYGYDADSLQMKLLNIRLWLRRSSRIYALLGNATRALREKVGVAQSKKEIKDRVENWADQSSDAVLYKYGENGVTILSQSYRLNAIDLDRSETKEGFEVLKKVILEMKDKTDQENIDLRIVIIPTKELIYYKYSKISGLNNLGQLDEYAKKEEKLLNTVQSFFDDEDIKYHVVLDDMAKSIEDGKLIYSEVMDGHPMPEGYQVIAESVNNYLFNNAIVSTSTEDIASSSEVSIKE